MLSIYLLMIITLATSWNYHGNSNIGSRSGSRRDISRSSNRDSSSGGDSSGGGDSSRVGDSSRGGKQKKDKFKVFVEKYKEVIKEQSEPQNKDDPISEPSTSYDYRNHPDTQEYKSHGDGPYWDREGAYHEGKKGTYNPGDFGREPVKKEKHDAAEPDEYSSLSTGI